MPLCDVTQGDILFCQTFFFPSPNFWSYTATSPPARVPDTLLFGRGGQACQVSTRGKTRLFDKLLLPACVCQSASAAWLTHQFEVARFVGCTACVAARHPATPWVPSPHLPSLPAAGVRAFRHAWGVFSSRCAAGLHYPDMVIEEWFKGNVETLDTLLLGARGGWLTAPHVFIKADERWEAAMLRMGDKISVWTFLKPGPLILISHFWSLLV